MKTRRLTLSVLALLVAATTFAAESSKPTKPAPTTATPTVPVAAPTPAPAPPPPSPEPSAKEEAISALSAQLKALSNDNQLLTAKIDLLTKVDHDDRFLNRIDANTASQQELIKAIHGLVAAKESTPTPVPAPPVVTPLPPIAAPLTPAPTAVPTPVPAPVAAASAVITGVSETQSNINYVWIIITGAMVFFMQAGFVMLEIGACRAKNTINIVMKSFLDFCICAIVFLFVGCPLMFGTSWNGIIGTDGFNLATLGNDHKAYIFFFFQLGFAGVSCTILSGAVAERTKFLGYLLYCAFFCVFIYPVIGHWVWGSFGGSFGLGGTPGWLEKLGFIDYAGSTVVHACGGACSLAGILAVGPRVGRFGKDGTPRLIAGHNIPLVTLGVLLLWFGWFGFNAGSSLSATSVIGRLVVNTTICPAAAGIAAMLSMWFMQGKPDVNIAMNGALGGAVAITACCFVVTPAAGVAIGILAGIITTVATIALERWQIDDAVGAVPVHLACGWWGTLSAALFNEAGFSIERLGVQALGTFSVSIYCFVTCSLFFAVVKLIVPLRATEEEQLNGLDFTEHAANAYPDFQTTEQA